MLDGHVRLGDFVHKGQATGVRRTMTLRRSLASALRSTSPRSARRSMRFVIAPVVTIVRRTSMPAVSSYSGPLRRRVASTSYIQFSRPKRAKFSARRRSTRRDRRDPADHADR